MSEKNDIYFRAHTVVIDKPKRAKKEKTCRRGRCPKWPKYALVFDPESRIDTGKELTFGFYRILKLNGDAYELAVEGAFFDDDLPEHERTILESYTATEAPDVTCFPPQFPR